MSKMSDTMARLAFPDNVVEGVDFNLMPRNCFRAGYEQAEKDLALTWEDVQLLDTFVLELVREEGKRWGGGEKFYTEVLTRFKQFKEAKK